MQIPVLTCYYGVALVSKNSRRLMITALTADPIKVLTY